MNRVHDSAIRIRITADLICLALITLLVQYQFASNSVQLFSSGTLTLVLLCQICWVFCARSTGLYKDFRAIPFSYEWIVFLKALVLYSLVISFVFFQIFKNFTFERPNLIFHCAFIFIILPIEKLVIRIIFKAIRNSRQVKRKVLIVGAGDSGLKFYQNYVKDNYYGYVLTGFLDDKANPSLNGYYLGKTTDIANVIATHELDDIIVTLPISDESQIKRIVTAGEKEGKRIRIIPHYQQFGSGKIQIETLGTQPIITLRSLPLDVFDNKLYKRTFDILFSSIVILFLLSWLVPIISLIIKLTSKGPIFFKQERWGLNNKPIICYKFRTMIPNSDVVDASGSYQQARRNDPRVTRIGTFLRRTSLDELPQFFNVLLGSMSVIGPRPHPVPLNLESKDSVENYMMRHWVKPGISGWAQVNGYRGETRRPHLMKKRVQYDLWYLENWTFWLDLQIILQTLVNMVKREKNAF
ncbi:MAG: undecaprenyl-phosphate glucose phosphotransferase [Chitinophagaceae bacterium]|nr:MAG: undecaprenyl-phosphate glucose phosphotransferase [Chitinophagaceae bacterium]